VLLRVEELCPRILPAASALFDVQGDLTESDWNRSTLHKTFEEFAPNASWDQTYTAQYRSAVSGGSYVRDYGSADNTTLVANTEIYLNWAAGAGGWFDWPSLADNRYVNIYVRGPANTPFTVNISTTGQMTSLANSPDQFWQEGYLGDTVESSTTRSVSWPLDGTGAFTYSGQTSGAPINVDGQTYTLAPLPTFLFNRWQEEADIDVNGNIDLVNIAGKMTLTTRITVESNQGVAPVARIGMDSPPLFVGSPIRFTSRS
jgi:hypothetical protein